MPNELTPTQAARRAELENIVDAAGCDLVMGLMCLKEEGLYSPQTWEEYCWDRFKFKARTIDLWIADHKLKVEKVFLVGGKPSHNREYAKFDPALQQAAVDALSGDKVTNKAIVELHSSVAGKPLKEAEKIIEQSKNETMRRAVERRHASEADKEQKALASVERKANVCLLAAATFTEAALGRLEGLIDTEVLKAGWQLVKDGAEMVLAAVEAERG